MAAGAVLLTGVQGAQAAGVAPTSPAYGAAIFVVGRDCSTVSPDLACTKRNGATYVPYQHYEGGPGRTVQFSVKSDTNSNAAASTITFQKDALPEIKQSDTADLNTRVNVNAFAFNSFTYEGAGSTPLSYSASLHIVNSSGTPTSGNYDLPGGAGYYAYIAIWDPSAVSDFLDAPDPFNNGYGNYACGDPGVLATGVISGGLAGGDQSLSVTTTSCSGSPVVVNHGQTVLAVAFLQTPVNRGGFVDASHTFTVGYDTTTLDTTTISNLESSMSPGVAGAPEPAAWSLMIAGVGMIGAALRRRRMLVARAG